MTRKVTRLALTLHIKKSWQYCMAQRLPQLMFLWAVLASCMQQRTADMDYYVQWNRHLFHLPAICLGGHLLISITSCNLQSTFLIFPLPELLQFCSRILVVLASRICPASAGFLYAITPSSNHSTGVWSTGIWSLSRVEVCYPAKSCSVDIVVSPTPQGENNGVIPDNLCVLRWSSIAYLTRNYSKHYE